MEAAMPLGPNVLRKLEALLAARQVDLAWGTTYVPLTQPDNYAGRVESNRAAYHVYLIEREDAAICATNGYMLSAAGHARGIDPGTFFHPNASKRPGRKWMSPEMRSWMGDGDAVASDDSNGGGLMSFTRWRHLTERKRSTEA